MFALAISWLRSSPTAFAVLLALAIGGAVTTTGVVAARSIAQTVREARDSSWLKRLSEADAAARENALQEAARAREAVEAARAAAESEEAARARVSQLEQRIQELTEDPMCFSEDIVKELNR